MAKKRNNSEPSGHEPADAPPAGANAGEARRDTATRRTPAPTKMNLGRRLARPRDDYDEEDEDRAEDSDGVLEAHEVYDVDEDDEDEEFVTPELPPEVVPNDNPDLLAFLRGTVAQGVASPSLADQLREWEDPRADAVQELCTPRPILPDPWRPIWEPFTLVASGQWYARLTSSRVVARAYGSTPLHGFLSAYGKPEAVRAHRASGPTAKSVLDAVEQCRLRLVLTLFGLKAEELEAPPDDSPQARIARLAYSLRAVGRRAVSRVCRVIRAEPELGRALSSALLKDRYDRGLWEMVMDELNPDWRDGVAFPTAP
jgi:hypothetical protein